MGGDEYTGRAPKMWEEIRVIKKNRRHRRKGFSKHSQGATRKGSVIVKGMLGRREENRGGNSLLENTSH